MVCWIIEIITHATGHDFSGNVSDEYSTSISLFRCFLSRYIFLLRAALGLIVLEEGLMYEL